MLLIVLLLAPLMAGKCAADSNTTATSLNVTLAGSNATSVPSLTTAEPSLESNASVGNVSSNLHNGTVRFDCTCRQTPGGETFDCKCKTGPAPATGRSLKMFPTSAVVACVKYDAMKSDAQVSREITDTQLDGNWVPYTCGKESPTEAFSVPQAVYDKVLAQCQAKGAVTAQPYDENGFKGWYAFRVGTEFMEYYSEKVGPGNQPQLFAVYEKHPKQNGGGCSIGIH